MTHQDLVAKMIIANAAARQQLTNSINTMTNRLIYMSDEMIAAEDASTAEYNRECEAEIEAEDYNRHYVPDIPDYISDEMAFRNILAAEAACHADRPWDTAC
jgi:hypothetical protein